MPPAKPLPALDDMESHAEDAARLLRSLANPNRLMLLCALTKGELSVSALNDCVPLSQSALSQHLAVMREEGLVATRRESQTIYYSVVAGPALQVLEVLYTAFCDGSRKPVKSRQQP
jgi:DNA-binding transcriptional ArsR family regulator